MSVTVVVGGQKGDEGKGKISAYLARKNDFDICMRISGPNAGHTIKYNGKNIGLVTLPCGFINKRARILVGRGAYIDVAKFLSEVDEIGAGESSRIGVDEYATIITDSQKNQERENAHLMKEIGSVGTGLGPARISKIKRGADVVFAKDVPELEPFLTDTTAEIFQALQEDKNILLEGDQGFGLSLIHGEFPFVTSRDTTASTFLGEAGIGPTAVKDVYVVFKPYATRVATGPLEDEMEEVSDWFHTKGGEVGTVSGRKRRVGQFEWENAKKAVQTNGATKICITHIDVFGELKDGELPKEGQEFIDEVKNRLGGIYPYPEVSLISYGPGFDEVKEL
jgi:adenylosuccinate synthase